MDLLFELHILFVDPIVLIQSSINLLQIKVIHLLVEHQFLPFDLDHFHFKAGPGDVPLIADMLAFDYVLLHVELVVALREHLEVLLLF